jgi:23S rRNA (uracil1939-C5)-methyltransferase
MTMLKAGDHIDVAIEKPAAGGRMIARHEGQIVLVSGAIPGERVRARVERADRRLAFAAAHEILEASPDRREAFDDPLCGGCLYSHIAYARQTMLKAEIIRDAFLRIGRIPLAVQVSVAPSPEQGYRMRARLHVHGDRVGFYREGTHALCDPATSGQLAAEALDVVRAAVAAIVQGGGQPISVELTENLAGDERALMFDVENAPRVARTMLDGIVGTGAVRGCVVRDERTRRVVGDAFVSDPLSELTAGRAAHGNIARGPGSFFQANRFIVPGLVSAVLDAVKPSGAVLDLYAGVGVFSLALAATGRQDVVAVEGERASAGDFQRNAGAFGSAVRLIHDGVEEALRRKPSADTVIVDPPRTGVSAEAMASLTALGASRIVYVSCDPATMARDARKLLDAGYSLERLEGFDMFPNTPHVETLGLFVR